MNRVLRTLQSSSPDVEASALISEDGLMIASALPQHIEEARVGAMSSSILSLGSRAARELERGNLKEVLVRGDQGFAVLMSAGSGSLLLALATESAKLGLLFLDTRRAAEEIKRVL
ncbi:MAG: hypothetical protein B7733_22860 [Myxococcales bacterium FL481]|nr:MAG: hypothetical protein B7733_22860 [Myxococcales bacterium FL481]